MARTATVTGNRPSLKMVEFAAVTPNESKEAIKTLGGVAKTVHMVPIDAIKVAPGFNLRVTESPEYVEALQLLKLSIMTEGFYNTKPLAGFVSKEKDGTPVLYVTDGHRRLEAAKLAVAEGAEIDKLPVILKAPGTTTLDLTVALHKENSGEKLSMLEQAVLAKRLMTNGMSEADVAMRLGLTPRYVSDLLTLITAPKEVRALVTQGKVSGTMAVKAVREHKVDAGEKLAEMVAKAEAKGKAKATAKEAGAGATEPGVKMETRVTRVEFTKGQRIEMATIEPFVPLFEDSDWFALTDEEGMAEISEPIELSIKVRRPKKEVVEAAAEAEADDAFEADPETDPEMDTSEVTATKPKINEEIVEKAKKKRGRPPTQRNFTSDEEEETVPDVQIDREMEVTSDDLAKLGIADPAADL